VSRNVSVDSKEVRELEKSLGITAPKELKKSMRRAISRTRVGTRQEASKQVRTVYNIASSRFKQGVVLTRPDYRAFSFRLIGKKKPIGLAAFTAGRPRNTKAGVTVAVEKGKRKLIKKAFIARSPNGTKQVFTRYIQKGQPPSPRLPIRSLKGPSASDMMLGSDLDIQLAEFAQARFLEVLQRNLKFFLGR